MKKSIYCICLTLLYATSCISTNHILISEEIPAPITQHTTYSSSDSKTETKMDKTTQLYLNYHKYQSQSATWIRTYILDEDNNLRIYEKEMQLIANLIYLSFMRSYTTLLAQKEALNALNIVWNSWQNIAQTRLDPSKQAPHELSNTEQNYTLTTFWKLHDQHQTIGKAYAQAVENIVHGDFLLSVRAKNSVQNMRNQARTVVAQSIIDVKNYIGKLFYTDKADSPKEKIYKALLQNKAISFFSYLWEYVPKLAITSFAEANKTNDIVSQESWNILYNIQQIGKQTWETIEQERASFYFAFYKAIWYAIRTVGLDTEYLNISFDQNGFLPMNPVSPDQNALNTFLPEPETLNVSQNLEVLY